jgi:hypothetical protein
MAETEFEHHTELILIRPVVISVKKIRAADLSAGRGFRETIRKEPNSYRRKRTGQRARAHYVHQAMLEADFQDLAVIAHEPPVMRIRKSDGPEAAHFRQHDPSLAFIAAFAMARMRKSAAKTTAPL